MSLKFLGRVCGNRLPQPIMTLGKATGSVRLSGVNKLLLGIGDSRRGCNSPSNSISISLLQSLTSVATSSTSWEGYLWNQQSHDPNDVATSLAVHLEAYLSKPSRQGLGRHGRQPDFDLG
ncbi:hypothetical protein ACFE04_012646 [Oxalis oulophora]